MNPSQETEDTSPDISDLNIPKRSRPGLSLVIEEQVFGICRLEPDVWIPSWVHASEFSSISRSRDELSIVCEARLIPEGVHCERGWRAIRVAETLDFSLIGVLDSLARPLTEAKVSIFCISSFDTDYLLVREKLLDRAVATLRAAGHVFATELKQETEPQEVRSGRAAAANPEDQRKSEEPPRKSPEPAETPPDTSEPASGEEIGLANEPSADHAPGSGPRDEEPHRDKPHPEKLLSEKKVAIDDEAKPAIKDRVSEALAELGAVLKPRAAVEPTPTVDPTPTAESDLDVETEAPKGEPPWKKSSLSRTEDPEPVGDDFSPSEGETVDLDSLELDEEEDLEIEVEEFDELGGSMFTGAIPQHPVELTDKSFGHLGLSNEILETVHKVGFKHPTPIQVRVIPEALKGNDVIGLAETGSGKTAAFCLPLAERLTHGTGVRGLILSPTREIALQTKSFLDIFGRYHELHTVLLIGGVKMGPQITGLRKKPDILVATPGRLADHLRRGNVRLNVLEELVLDEADHMLDLGFLPQIKEILEQAPKRRRTMMFSATMPPPIERLAQMFMHEPVRVDIRPVGQVAEGIEHRLYLVRDEDRKACLLKLIEELPGSTLIFTRRKVYTEWLARQLEVAGLAVERIHSDRSQSQRVQALRGFREGKFRILVATDVAARGIDVPRIEHVINYGLPETIEDYVHRAGRTARGNALGIVSSIGTWQDKITVRDIERTLNITMPRCTVEGVEPYVELPKRKTVRRRRLL